MVTTPLFVASLADLARCFAGLLTFWLAMLARWHLLGLLVCWLAEGAQWLADFNRRVGAPVCQFVCLLADCVARSEHPMSITDTAGIE